MADGGCLRGLCSPIDYNMVSNNCVQFAGEGVDYAQNLGKKYIFNPQYPRIPGNLAETLLLTKGLVIGIARMASYYDDPDFHLMLLKSSVAYATAANPLSRAKTLVLTKYFYFGVSIPAKLAANIMGAPPVFAFKQSAWLGEPNSQGK